MTVENDFLVFAGQSGANVVTQAAYVGQAWQQTGFVSGIAQSAQLNKPWRQSSIMAAVLAQFIVNNSGQPAIDDGTTATLLANLQTAVGLAASHGRAVFTGNGSFTAPVTGTYYFSGCGAGGGGGSSLNTNAASFVTGGSGGGAGQPAIRVPVTLTAGQVVPITTGAPGSGGTAATNNATAGGATQFGAAGALLNLAGGSPGSVSTGGTTLNSYYAGVAGGAGFPAGDYASDTASFAAAGSGFGGFGGRGASGPFGQSGPAGRGANTSAVPAGAGTGYGAGGSGAGGAYAASSTAPGAAGAAGLPGFAMIEW